MTTNQRTCCVHTPAGASFEIGAAHPLAIIAGPCTLESRELGMQIGTLVRDTCASLGLSYIFKASFDKANRTSMGSPRGPGMDQGLDWLAHIRDALQVPVTTDVHHPEQADRVAQVVDVLQIPAFLCRQTDLLVACAEAATKHNRAVNIKKGQFLSPQEMAGPVNKTAEAGCTNVMLTERGTFFGYNRLVNDFIGMGDLMELNVPGGAPPLCFDATHSTQLPGAGAQSGGRPERAPMLARAAVAAGVHAVFLECHPDPKNAMSDGATMQKLETVPGLLKELSRICINEQTKAL
ncbi:MAG: 3-deoxy-8-phosphooctulonate synthase [Phycisphaeraceae bacterium]|nr:3-deoxy-8-phosphooctulonate synthase [Phycisphaerales bacterium]MCB9860700.1 3-deoxy-8-phosphooctulonate synthase [Phycisphaeraceae bacterium]